MNIFLTSDIHFNHVNILKYCNRPFKDVSEMNEVIIRNFNSVVHSTDTVYHLGDFCFGIHNDLSIVENFIRRLNGNWIFIEGNHDKHLKKVVQTHKIYEFNYKKTPVTLCHFAMKLWNHSHHGSIHCYGHSHGTLKEDQYKSMDVGVDTHNYFPWHMDEVMARMEKKTVHKIDHHGNETN